MLTVLVDYDSGNLHSAEKAFQRMAAEVGGGEAGPGLLRAVDGRVVLGAGLLGPAGRRVELRLQAPAAEQRGLEAMYALLARSLGA